MKNPLLITIGLVLIVLVLGVWLYLLFFGTPDTADEVFSDLGFDIASQPVNVVAPEIPAASDTFVDTAGEKLRQITTRPVAGFVSFFSSSTDLVRYAERGTGHIYELNISTKYCAIILRFLLL